LIRKRVVKKLKIEERRIEEEGGGGGEAQKVATP
jgi:hypothetical protein